MWKVAVVLEATYVQKVLFDYANSNTCFSDILFLFSFHLWFTLNLALFDSSFEASMLFRFAMDMSSLLMFSSIKVSRKDMNRTNSACWRPFHAAEIYGATINRLCSSHYFAALGSLCLDAVNQGMSLYATKNLSAQRERRDIFLLFEPKGVISITLRQHIKCISH